MYKVWFFFALYWSLQASERNLLKFLCSTSKGIYELHVDLVAKKVMKQQLVSDLKAECLVHKNEFTYALSSNEQGFGILVTLKRNKEGFQELHRIDSGGKTACFMEVNKKVNMLWVANFRRDSYESRGSLSEFMIQDDQKLTLSQWWEHEGRGLKEPRQLASHPHSVVLSPRGLRIAIGDLGIDALVMYQLDYSGKVKIDSKQEIYLGAGTGPRHVVFHPKEEVVFVNTEQSSELIAVEVGSGKELARVSIRPEGRSAPADIAIHPNGRYIYNSIRGSDKISITLYDHIKSSLKTNAFKASGGKNARCLKISPCGNYLMAVHQESGEIVFFHVINEGKDLETIDLELKLPKPSHVIFTEK